MRARASAARAPRRVIFTPAGMPLMAVPDERGDGECGAAFPDQGQEVVADPRRALPRHSRIPCS